MIDVLLVGDVRLSREGIADLLRRDGSVRVSATATSSASDDIATKAHAVDVVVIDTTCKHGVQAAAVIAAAANKPAVAFGLRYADEAVIGLAVAGVIGFVDLESGVDELVAGIEAAAREEAYCPPSIARMLMERIRALSIGRVVRRDSLPLTAREHQIVELIAEGLTNKEIARRLSIEVATVKNHVHNILDKLQVRRRADAAAQLRLVERTALALDEPEGSRAQSGVA
jgi:DNA-binding NarL/FixJ family response regulator